MRRCCAARIGARISPIFCSLCRRSNWRTRCFRSAHAKDRRAREGARAWTAGGGAARESGHLFRRLQSAGGAATPKRASFKAAMWSTAPAKCLASTAACTRSRSASGAAWASPPREPLYVVDIDEQSKRVVVGKKNELSCARLNRAFGQLARSASGGDRSRSADSLSRAGGRLSDSTGLKWNLRSPFRYVVSSGDAGTSGGVLSRRSGVGGGVDRARAALARSARDYRLQIPNYRFSDLEQFGIWNL